MAQHKSPVNGVPLPRGKPFTKENAKAMGHKGGTKSAEQRAIARTLREELELLLAEERESGGGRRMTVQAGITSALVKQALDGNTRAYELIRDTLGQKPTENVNVNAPDVGIMKEIKAFMESVSK